MTFGRDGCTRQATPELQNPFTQLRPSGHGAHGLSEAAHVPSTQTSPSAQQPTVELQRPLGVQRSSAGQPPSGNVPTGSL
jgi:hypothetical protein